MRSCLPQIGFRPLKFALQSPIGSCLPLPSYVQILQIRSHKPLKGVLPFPPSPVEVPPYRGQKLTSAPPPASSVRARGPAGPGAGVWRERASGAGEWVGPGGSRCCSRLLPVLLADESRGSQRVRARSRYCSQCVLVWTFWVPEDPDAAPIRPGPFPAAAAFSRKALKTRGGAGRGRWESPEIPV